MSKERGYKLNCTGKIVTPENLDDLTPEELKELVETPMTAWEFLQSRKSNHDLRNVVQDFFSSTGIALEDINEKLDSIDKKLRVDVGNGKKTSRLLTEVVAEIYEDHEKHRKRERLWRAISQNKSLIFSFFSIFLILFIGFDLILHHYFPLFTNTILTGLIPIIPAGVLAPLLVSIFKKIFKID